MATMKEAAAAFLANKRIAVTGVSRRPADHGANTVFKRLRDRGYEVGLFDAMLAESEDEWDQALARSQPSPTGTRGSFER